MAKTTNGKSLVIVESPAKAKTINKYLGGDFEVSSVRRISNVHASRITAGNARMTRIRTMRTVHSGSNNNGKIVAVASTMTQAPMT